MSRIHEALLYAKDREWILLHEDGNATVGMTDFAQESLGDITFVESPSVGGFLEAGDPFGVLESVKAASDLFMSVDAEVLEINDVLESEPELLNRDSYEQGGLLKIRIINVSQVDSLLKAGPYSELA
jgi:glycine cleavage system H protein